MWFINPFKHNVFVFLIQLGCSSNVTTRNVKRAVNCNGSHDAGDKGSEANSLLCFVIIYQIQLLDDWIFGNLLYWSRRRKIKRNGVSRGRYFHKR